MRTSFMHVNGKDKGYPRLRLKTFDIAPLSEATSSQKRCGVARVVKDLTVLPATHAFIRKREPCFAFSAEAGPHVTDPGRMEG